MDSDYYDLLGVPGDATQAQIQDAYRKLALAYHPDRNQGATEEVRRIAEERLRALNEAYEVLSDAAKRRTYDARRWSTGASQTQSKWAGADAYAQRENLRQHARQACHEHEAGNRTHLDRLRQIEAEIDAVHRERERIVERYDDLWNEIYPGEQAAAMRYAQSGPQMEAERRHLRVRAIWTWLLTTLGTLPAVLVGATVGWAVLPSDNRLLSPNPDVIMVGLGVYLLYEWVACAAICAGATFRLLPRGLLVSLLFIPALGALMCGGIAAVSIGTLIVQDMTAILGALLVFPTAHLIAGAIALIGVGWGAGPRPPRSQRDELRRRRDRELRAFDTRHRAQLEALWREHERLSGRRERVTA